MSVSAVGLQQIQQTLGDLATPSSASSGASSAQEESFMLALAQATNDVSTMNSLSGLSGDALFNQETGGGDLTSSTTPSNSFTSELAALVDSQSTSSASAGIVPTATTGSPSTVASGPTGAQVVSEAQQYEGTPYVWGGTTPSGFDCSGFTQYIYGQLGVQIPRTSEEQATAGTAVTSLADAQPGDLLFFAGSDGTASAPGHVGIYVGNGNMIDAPHTGTTVQVQAVADAGPVVAIRQILPSAPTSTASAVMGNVTVPAQYVSTVEQAANTNGIPASLLAGLIQQESGFNPDAVSSAGAEGIAQFMPATAAGMGVDPYNPTSAINGAAAMLGSYTRQFGSYADALAAYNAGSSAVERYGGIPPYAETQAYVPAVLSLAGLSNEGSAA